MEREAKSRDTLFYQYMEHGTAAIVERRFLTSLKVRRKLDDGLHNWHSAMASASAASAFYTSTPLATALCKGNVQLGTLLLALAFFVPAALRTGSYLQIQGASYTSYRFTALELRGGDAPGEKIRVNFFVWSHLCLCL